MKRDVPVREFVDELLQRIDSSQEIDCCKDEIKKFAMLAKEKMGDETIEIDWKD